MGEALSVTKKALLSRLLSGGPTTSIGRSALGPSPLSFAQERLWFLEQLWPGTGAYNLHFCYHLVGHLDQGSLERALTALVARHEPLRTRFIAEGSRVQQVVDDPSGIDYEVVRSSGLPMAMESAATEARRPFDLRVDPPMRI